MCTCLLESEAGPRLDVSCRPVAFVALSKKACLSDKKRHSETARDRDG